VEKKIKLQEGSYKYKGFLIERIDADSEKPYVHWNIGSEVAIYNSDLTEIDWHDAANTLKDAMALIDANPNTN
jgi:hypothetical protein|tara:strand:- start:1366 stop:1584 length:219 start_codon:yes stop_codon:yes gene_type:complete